MFETVLKVCLFQALRNLFTRKYCIPEPLLFLSKLATELYRSLHITFCFCMWHLLLSETCLCVCVVLLISCHWDHLIFCLSALFTLYTWELKACNALFSRVFCIYCLQRLVDLNRGSGLGLTLRGGSDHNLGIYVSSVDADSSAAASGFQVTKRKHVHTSHTLNTHTNENQNDDVAE